MVLDGANEGWLNIIHLHGNNVMFRIFKDYPVQVINWHIGETLPEIEEGHDLSTKCILGGLNRMDITNKNINEIQNQIYTAVKKLKKQGHILSPGCVIRYPLDEDFLQYIKETKEFVEKSIHV